MSTMTLYRICILKVASLLKTRCWMDVIGTEGENPFSYLPSSLIDELVRAVGQLSPPGGLKVMDLYYLLTSGRVEHFKLDDVLLETEDLVSILMSLSVASQNLRSLILKNVNCTDPYTKNSKFFQEVNALECLLKVSPQLETLDSCLSFDLKVIRNCQKLKTLKLNFVRTKPLYNFLEEDNGMFWPNDTLKYLELFEDYRNPIPYLDLVPILKYCTQLTHLNVDISRSLEFLHSEELYEGSLDTHYKLEKCYLGSSFVDNGAASTVALHIATLTCPNMKEVDILVNEHETIYALSDFRNLTSLLIQWELPTGGNFQLGIQPMLEKAGASLRNLHILNFFRIDFSALATACPEIEVLKCEFHSEYRGYECPSAGLQHLKSLHLELVELDYGCSEETLIMLLSNCRDLTTLHIDGARSLHDGVLNQILAKNTLSNLKDAVVFESSLTEAGIRNLISHSQNLEFFQFSSTQVPFEEAADIVHEVNPAVILVAD